LGKAEWTEGALLLSLTLATFRRIFVLAAFPRLGKNFRPVWPSAFLSRWFRLPEHWQSRCTLANARLTGSAPSPSCKEHTMTKANGSGAPKTQRPKAILCLCHDGEMLLIRRMLLEHFGYSVLSTTSVEDARNIARERCPDMLLIDNGDLGMEYAHLAEQVKNICPEVITVVLSTYYRVSSKSPSSIDRFVVKDDGPDALIAQIRELFDGDPERQLDAIQ
jgi:CheY-like chemotaxis protein